MELRVHIVGTGIYVQKYDKKEDEWNIVKGPYANEQNAKVGICHYRKKHEVSFHKKIGTQVMSKSWGEVVL